MRRNKTNSLEKNTLKDDPSHERDVYLPSTESSLEILYNFDDLDDIIKRRESADEVRHLTEEDSVKGKQYKLSTKLPSEPTACSTLPSSKLVFCEDCSLRGVSEDKDSSFSSKLEAEYDFQVYSSDMKTTFLPRSRKQINFSCSKSVDTGNLEKSKSRTLSSEKELLHHSKDLVGKINNDYTRTSESLPLLQTLRQEKTENLSGNKRIFRGNKQGSKGCEHEMGTVNGKKLSNSLSPEFHNLRHFLPLLTLCQCPDYDSAIIEVVRDYNDPCRGVASHMYPPC